MAFINLFSILPLRVNQHPNHFCLLSLFSPLSLLSFISSLTSLFSLGQKSMESFLDMSGGDVLASEHWQVIRKSLTSALGDTDRDIRCGAIRFAWKLFKEARREGPVQTGEVIDSTPRHIITITVSPLEKACTILGTTGIAYRLG